MEGTGKFVGGRWGPRIELLPGEFEVFSKKARRGWRSGRLILTNQRIIWRPGLVSRSDETAVLRIAHERVTSADVGRSWHSLFMERLLRIKLASGEMLLFSLRDLDALIPTIRQYMSEQRYRPGELFKS